MMQKKFMLVSLLSLSAIFAVQGIDFVKNGKFASIEVSPKATSSEKLAKSELEKYFSLMTGQQVKTGLPDKIILGTPATLPGLPAKVAGKLRNSKNDAFYLYSDGPHKLYVAGNNSLGVLYGAYEVLEKLGVRWFYQGELGEEIPSKKDFSLPDLNDYQMAAVKWRSFNVCGTTTDFPGMFFWEIRNKMQVENACDWKLPQYRTKAAKQAFRDMLMIPNHVGGHEWAVYAVPVSMFKDHPEYFILRKGKRVCQGRVERCYSNPEVRRLAVKYYKDVLKKDPNAHVCVIAHDASDAFCECDNCKKMGTYQGKFTVSTLFHTFFTGIMKEVVKDHPDAVINIMAYWNYRDAPEDPAITYNHKNAFASFASHQRCYAHDYVVKNPCNRKFVEDMLKWEKHAPALGLYDYRYGAGNYYAPLEWVMASDMKIFSKMNFVAWEDETLAFNGVDWDLKKHPENVCKAKSNWQSHYMACKMCWDPSADPQKIMEDAYNIYYGKAAPVMKKYHALRTALWNAAPGHCTTGGIERVAYCLANPDAEKQLVGMLDQAMRLAGTDKVRRRIEQDRKFLNMFWKKSAEQLKKRLAGAKEVLPEACTGKMVIDGILNEEVWLKAQPVSGLLTRDQKPSVENTSVRVAYDKDNLYIGVNADNQHAWSQVKAEAKKHDGPAWSDDSIEIQIQPSGTDGIYYHWIINTIGTVYDSRCIGASHDAKWDSGAEVKVRKNGKTFVYEIRIPFASLKTVPGVTPWKFHLMRTITNLQPPSCDEWASFDGNAPYKPESYRNMVFGKNLIPNGNFAVLKKSKVGGKEVMFPQKWELYGDTNFKLEKTAAGHNVITKGVFTIGFAVPKGLPEGKNYHFAIRAKGKGNLTVSNWSWEGYQPRTNHRRLHNIPAQKLSAEFKDHVFVIPCLPKESYFILYIGGDKTVQNVSCMVK